MTTLPHSSSDDNTAAAAVTTPSQLLGQEWGRRPSPGLGLLGQQPPLLVGQRHAGVVRVPESLSGNPKLPDQDT